MIVNYINNIHRSILELYKIVYNEKELELNLHSFHYPQDAELGEFLNYLVESGSLNNLVYLKNTINRGDIVDLLKKSFYPLLVLQQREGEIVPLILFKEEKKIAGYVIKNDIPEIVTIVPDEAFANSLIKPVSITTEDISSDNILVITCFPNKSIYSEDGDNFEIYQSSSKIGSFQRFFRILISEKREIWYLYIYAVISGIISLALPLGVQSIIGLISSGQASTSVMVLIGFIVISIFIAGGMQVMQLSIVERIQQRLFTKTAFEFAFRLPKIKVESVLNYYPPELMNRFFDIITLQKGLAKILLEFSAAILQIILGLFLLSLYHPYFIFFSIFLVSILLIIFRVTGPKGLATNNYESKYKYQVANWLEEIARSLSTFKLAGYSNLPAEKTDLYVSNYLHARTHHFKVLVVQYISFVLFKTLITAGLLVLGAVLVVTKEINIGQFVASEIVIILIINAVEKIILQLDNIYDILTSLEKIGNVTDLPIEMPMGIKMDKIPGPGFAVKVSNIKYKYPDHKSPTLSGISFEIGAGENLCICGYSNSGKTTLVNILLGFLPSYEGVVTFNGISLKDLNKNSLISQIGDNVSQEDLFDGTMVENITLGRNNVTIADVLWALEVVGLKDYINSLNDGLNTRLIGGDMKISDSIARKIIVARSIVIKPKLLILQDFLTGIEKTERKRIMEFILGKDSKWTVIMVSTEPSVMQLCDKIVVLKEGSIIGAGSYEEIKNENYFHSLV